MGRTVSVPTAARAVVFKYLEDEPHDVHSAAERYEHEVAKIRAQALHRWPSMISCATWIGIEDYAIAENTYAQVGVSEYCGLLSIWLLPRNAPDDLDRQQVANWTRLRDAWIDDAAGHLLSSFGTHMRIPGGAHHMLRPIPRTAA